MKKRNSRKHSKRNPEIPPVRFELIKRFPVKLAVLGFLSIIPITFAAMLFTGSGTFTIETGLGRAVVQREPGAAISISPNAVGASLENVRVVGYERALIDNGRGSNVKNFEAVR